MAVKNMAEVVIAGKVYKISGYESPEYLHQIAVYLNDKMTELQKVEGYRKQNADQKQLLLDMNLTDDFFKARSQADKLTGDLEKKERELYGVRHDLIEAQLALENQQRELEALKEKEKAKEKELASLKKKNAELEALLEQSTRPDEEEQSRQGRTPDTDNQSRQSRGSGRRHNGNNNGNRASGA